MNNFDALSMKNQVVEWIRKWFDENGAGCNAVVGISGGKDSSIVAALCVEALGKERVIGVLMPQGIQSDIDVSIDVCEHLGIDYYTINIFDVVRNLKHQVKEQLNERWSAQSSMNLPPRIRMATLYAIAQTLNGRVMNTSNLSERYIGWETRWGDAIGDCSPCGNFTATEVKLIGRATQLLKEEHIEKVPEDGLTGTSDEDNFGFTYSVLDEYIRTGSCEDTSVKERIDGMHSKNLFKMEMPPCFEF